MEIKTTKANILKIIILFLLMFGFITIPLHTQEGEINYNEYYRFLLSVGAEYQMLTPFSDYARLYNIYEVGANIKFPLPFFPMLQPALYGGMITFDYMSEEESETWDHRHFFGLLGVLYCHRFSKNFEIGGGIAGGYSMAMFPNLIPEEGILGTNNLLFEAMASICINPSYNLNIEIKPNLKYLYSLSPLEDFNGLIFGLGFSLNFRLGEDPDSPAAAIRSIRFDDVTFPPVFAAMQSYYIKNPLTTVKISNIEGFDITDIEVSFFQSGYMDSPTPCQTIPTVKAGETIDVDILASFNSEVFITEGITPLTGEIIVTYLANNRPAEQRQAVSFDLHDKTAIVWNDDKKVAAFITPADSALRNYTSYIRQACKNEVLPQFCDPLQFAIQVYYALNELGLIYQVDPIAPFTSVQNNAMVVDSISLARDTLKRITGDCDDLTVLYCSLMETAGIESGFITVPGHIYAVFNTKVPTADYKTLHPDREMSINIDGELWIPVEITLIAQRDFLTAWRKGMEEWNSLESDLDKRAFYNTRKCQELYRSVGLKETDLGLQYGSAQKIAASFKEEMSRLANLIVREIAAFAQERGWTHDYNRLGITYARFKQYAKAVESFNKAIAVDSKYAAAYLNIGNIHFLKGEYDKALSQFNKAYEILGQGGKEKSRTGFQAVINISKAYYELKEYDKSQSYFEKALAINPESARAFGYLGEVSSDTERAAGMEDSMGDILFSEGEE